MCKWYHRQNRTKIPVRFTEACVQNTDVARTHARTVCWQTPVSQPYITERVHRHSTIRTAVLHLATPTQTSLKGEAHSSWAGAKKKKKKGSNGDWVLKERLLATRSVPRMRDGLWRESVFCACVNVKRTWHNVKKEVCYCKKSRLPCFLKNTLKILLV